METNRLRQFKVLVETKHLRRAAELLSISHGGLYKSLKQLEEELGFPLFFSQGKRIEITPKGLEIYRQIPAILSAVDGIFKSKSEISTHQTLTLGTFEVFSTHLLGPLFKQDTWQEIHLRLVELVPGELELAIKSGEVDLGITYLPIPTRGVEFDKVAHLRMGVYGRKGAFQKQSSEKLPFVIPIRPLKGTPTGVRGLDGWPEQEVPRQVVYEVTLMESALELVRQGRAVVYLPEPVAREHNLKIRAPFELVEIQAFPKLPVVKRDIFIVRLEGRQEGKIEKQLASALRILVR